MVTIYFCLLAIKDLTNVCITHILAGVINVLQILFGRCVFEVAVDQFVWLFFQNKFWCFVDYLWKLLVLG